MIYKMLFVLIILADVATMSPGQPSKRSIKTGLIDGSDRSISLARVLSPNVADAVFVPSVKVTSNDGGSGQYLGNAVAIAGNVPTASAYVY